MTNSLAEEKREYLREKVLAVGGSYFGADELKKLLSSVPFYLQVAQRFFVQVTPTKNALRLEIAALVHGLLVDITYENRLAKQTILPLRHACRVELQEQQDGGVTLIVYSEQRWGFGYHALTGDSIDALQRFYRLILADLSRGGSHAN